MGQQTLYNVCDGGCFWAPEVKVFFWKGEYHGALLICHKATTALTCIAPTFLTCLAQALPDWNAVDLGLEQNMKSKAVPLSAGRLSWKSVFQIFNLPYSKVLPQLCPLNGLRPQPTKTLLKNARFVIKTNFFWNFSLIETHAHRKASLF